MATEHRRGPIGNDLRLLVVDLENVVGAGRPRERVLRARIGALLQAAGAVHHAVAGYAASTVEEDPVASVLAELGVAPLRVSPGPDAAEAVLLAHARRVHDTLGCRMFLVASADRRFAELASLGRLELFVWTDQPIATRLADVAHDVHRVPRPAMPPAEAGADVPVTGTAAAAYRRPAGNTAAGTVPLPSRPAGGALVERVLLAVATGMGIALGQRVANRLLPPRRR